jgi:hypothetical protein
MKLLNFALGTDAISVEWQGYYIDLHNCYEFQSINYNTIGYNTIGSEVELIWKVSQEYWAADEKLSSLRLVFKNIVYFQVKARDEECLVTDDLCLASLSFHPKEQRDEFETIVLDVASESDDLTFFFESDWGIKVNSESVELIPVLRTE